MEIESHTLWMRKIDRQVMFIVEVHESTLTAYEYYNPDTIENYSKEGWLEKCFLMGIDDAICELGGVF